MVEFLQLIIGRKDRLFHILLNVFLILIIYLNAEAGRLLGMGQGPLKISPVWPATGFSLAALLLFGPRAWPGVFLGNLAYNVPHLLMGSQTSLGSSITGFIVSVGSLIQGLVGWYVIHRFSSTGYLKSAKDVLVFLLGGGILTCTIASTIGVTALYYHGVLPGEYVFSTWLTFWLGDTLGVYIITPFLIVWSIAKWKKGGVKPWSLEACLMAVGFLAISWISLIKTYPLADLFIPLSIWVAYRCGIHGTVLLNIAIALTSTILTSFGYGCLVAYFPDSAMLVLVGFVEIIIGTALIVAAMINERVEKF